MMICFCKFAHLLLTFLTFLSANKKYVPTWQSSQSQMSFGSTVRQKCTQQKSSSTKVRKMRMKFLQRLLFDSCLLLYNKRFWLITIALVLFAWRNRSAQPSSTQFSDPVACCEPIDVVYTWVNGSDPNFIRSIQQFTSEFDPARFDDKNELKYSLRSLATFAPWIHHVYIVTNGQIPYWLNLASNRITVISHAQIAPATTPLPTFSSSTIETFIHRIPGLSKRFLYLNDDIFLGTTLYPEDLFTKADGVKIYTAWTVPDCSLGCPWVYIGDGSCDEICNNEECQFDGGDCNDGTDFYLGEYYTTPTTEKVVYEVPKVLSKNNKTALSLHNGTRRRKTQKFSELVRNHTSNPNDIKSIVDQFNDGRKKQTKSPVTTETSEGITSHDIFAKNLIYTNKLLNKIYGYRSRKVLAHVGFLLDVETVDDMLHRFRKQAAVTASHRFRNPSDLQFAFAYYHFMMSETRNITVADIFDEFDTDKSGTWSDREIRTLLARIYPLPLDWAIVRYFEQVVVNCSNLLGIVEDDGVQYTTLVYERYEDSNIPRVTKKLVTHCPPLMEVLLNTFAERAKYRFHVNPKTGIYSNFKMLTSNITEVVDALDELRKNPKKFNCINDNLEPDYPEENHIIKMVLEDFYLSYFPTPSEFELPDTLRNRFTNIHDYETWKKDKDLTMLVLYIFSAILCAIGLKYFCCHKAKYARKFIPYKYCDI